MENYTKGETTEIDDPLPFSIDNSLQMRVTAGSKIRNLMGFALKSMSDKNNRQITWNGSGPVVTKAITCAEIMKRRIKGLHQITKIRYKRIEELWEPKVEGLESLKVNRDIPAISILLSKDPLDSHEPGYQPPGNFEVFWQEKKNSGPNKTSRPKCIQNSAAVRNLTEAASKQKRKKPRKDVTSSTLSCTSGETSSTVQSSTSQQNEITLKDSARVPVPRKKLSKTKRQDRKAKPYTKTKGQDRKAKPYTKTKGQDRKAKPYTKTKGQDRKAKPYTKTKGQDRKAKPYTETKGQDRKAKPYTETKGQDRKAKPYTETKGQDRKAKPYTETKGQDRKAKPYTETKGQDRKAKPYTETKGQDRKAKPYTETKGQDRKAKPYTETKGQDRKAKPNTETKGQGRKAKSYTKAVRS